MLILLYYNISFRKFIKTSLLLFLFFYSLNSQAQTSTVKNQNINDVQKTSDVSYNEGDYTSESEIKWFPKTNVFPKLYGDGTAHQLSLSKDLFTRRFTGAIGGLQRLVQFNIFSIPVQTSLGVTVYATLYKQSNVVEVHTACFFVDLYFDIPFSENFSLRTGYGHYSSHIVDDGVEKLQISAINYAKDYIPLIAAYSIDSSPLWLYGGIRFDTYTIPEYNKRWNIQVGIEYLDFPITDEVTLYGAVDLKFKSEAAWGSTQSYQVGFKFLETFADAFRFAYTYRTGLDDRGQFYKNHINLSMLGLYFDF